MGRSKALDVIRGIAILMVLIYHYLPSGTGTPEFLVLSTRLFWSGVDMFFVLSGFLIAGILLDNLQAGNYFSTFYIRRAARIVPLYLALCVVFGIVLHYHPKIIRITYKNHLPFWSYLTFTQNFLYADRGFDNPWMDVTWSLAVEEQFYIFLSILIRYTSRRNVTILSIILILLAPILRFNSTLMQGYVLPLQRADSLMLGVLLAVGWRNEKWKGWLTDHVKLFRAAFVLLLAGACYLTYIVSPVGSIFVHMWLGLFYGVILILALTSDTTRRNSVFEHRDLEWLGLRSYCIYLMHKPVMIVIPVLVRLYAPIRINHWYTSLMEVIVLFCIAELSYRLFEKPIMDLGHRFKYRRPTTDSQLPAGAPS